MVSALSGTLQKRLCRYALGAIILSCLLAMDGCQRRFFAAYGTVAGHGGLLGDWSLTPDGCSVAPFDGLPPANSTSVVEFVWQHGRPRFWSKHGIADRWAQGPLILDIARAQQGLTGSLTLVQTQGPIRLDRSVCSVLRVDGHPGPAAVPGGRASLAGRLVMDCTVDDTHLTANVVFRGCTR